MQIFDLLIRPETREWLLYFVSSGNPGSKNAYLKARTTRYKQIEQTKILKKQTNILEVE